MKEQFDVWRFLFAEKGEYSVVVVSHPDRAARAKWLNVLYCTSQRQSRRPHPHEVMLNGADGFDWETFVDCSIMYAVESDKLFGKRGRVSLERRNAIRDKLRDIFRLAARD
ncbi:MAG TPA: type II toxin-antitoxin system PemK/MazF family toxin [Verrucomicrobiae bacterium]|nr:type II toxin-antitoxin system PemK/MazF family toxin [Verrucomicrobiae bacterium]